MRSALTSKTAEEKEKIILEYEKTAIESETAIAEQKKKETQEAETFISELLGDRYRQDEVKRQEQLDQLNKFYAQGLISASDYYDGLDALDKKYTSEFKRDLQERSEQLTLMANIINDRTKKMWDAVSGFFSTGFDDVKAYFGDMREALAMDIDGMENQVTSFLKTVNSGAYNTFWNATLFGRKMVETVGTSIYDWARRVADYIQYVKGLMQSLREQIMSYQDQLDQLRGNEVAIIDRWYQVELAKLKDQYAKELLNTKEYQEALTLLEELYREKRKQAAEQEAEEKARLLEEAKEEAESESSGGGGGLSLAPASAFENFAQQLDNIVQSLNFPPLAFETGTAGGETTIKKEINYNANYEIYTFDQEASRRWIGDVLFPEFMRILRLRGIDL